MDSEQRTGAGVILLGVSVISMTLITSTSSSAYTELYSFLAPAVTIIPGLCLIGLGIGKYTGKLNTTTGTASKRATAMLTVIAVALFSAGFLLAL
jgi:hypothetical protein